MKPENKMPHTDKTLRKHPGLNPKYFSGMKLRRKAQSHNRTVSVMCIGVRIAVPKQPNRYVPHYGAKEAAKYSTRCAV